jgi:periplasmic protein CpxP/Spy
MKRVNNYSNFCTAGLVIALLFCTFVFFTYPSTGWAQTDKSSGKSGASKVERTEDKIKNYHSLLKITPAQEADWNKVAQVMRDNASMMESLIQERKAKGNTLSAVEDLKSYSKIADAHAAGLKNFIAAFEPLYNSMSPEQKKNADTVFTESGHQKGQKKK